MTTLKASIFITIALFISNNAMALDDDINQPTLIFSDNQKIDIDNSFAIYSGNVTIKQGSILITADLLKIHNNGQPGQEVMVLTGNPATFSQALELDGTVKASAKAIRFERANNTITLNIDAQLQQNESLVKSQFISYDMAHKVLIANGNSKGDSDPSKRVITILQPTTDKKD
ncbi:MAG: lipopolysaccharide transport periplasmic protein LptA [Gammaproteobacteria bacterium]|nr:lipopolysaccharide transport periplasmic protein LptA [Gammaproteobacteria bacterium]